MTIVDKGYWKEYHPDPVPDRTPEIAEPAPAPLVRAIPSVPHPSRFGIGGATSRARVSVDEEGQLFKGLSSAALRSSLNADEQWRALDLDSRTLSRMTPKRIMQLLADLSPEVSRALWDFLRFGNPGWEAKASRPSGAQMGTGAHQKALDEFIARLAERHGTFDVLVGQLNIGAFLRGAYAAELVLNNAGRLALDIAVPDPVSIRFRRQDDPELGGYWQAGQYVGGQFVSLEMPTFKYIPIDPFPGDPYGRSPMQPALFAAIFMLSMLHDIRRVVQQQGYPRIDITVVMEKLLALMPDDAQGDGEKEAAWIQGAIAQVQSVYAGLEPDDAYVHPDVTQVNRPVGTLDSSSLGAVDGLIKALERMLVRALKTVPIMMGITDGVAEANVRVQWKIYSATIRAFQHTLEQMFDRLFQLALEAQGIAAKVEFTFAQSDIIDRLIDAQTDEITIRNARARYDNGWVSQDAAAQEGAGVEKADVPEPRKSGGGGSAEGAPAALAVSDEEQGAAA